MNANDCLLTIVISFNEKKFEIKTKNLLSIEDIKQRAIKELNLGKVELKNIQLSYIDEENKKCLINNYENIFDKANEIDEDNYKIELELSIEQAENNESKINKLKEEINKLNKKFNQKNEEFLKTKEENKKMWHDLSSLKNAKILNDVTNENKITQLKRTIDELNDKISDLNNKNKKYEKKSEKLKNIIEKIKNDKFDMILKEINNEKAKIECEEKGEEENYYEYEDLIISIDSFKKKELMKMEENYKEEIENFKEVEMKLKNANKTLLVKNQGLSYANHNSYLAMIICILLIFMIYFINNYDK